MTEKEQKQKEILIKEKELHTSELLKTANGNFDEALDYAPIDKNSVQVGKVMLKRSSTAHAEALKKLTILENNRRKQKNYNGQNTWKF